jgi:hypothetical protein
MRAKFGLPYEPLTVRKRCAGDLGSSSRAPSNRDVSVAARSSLVGGAAGALGLPAESACSGDLPGLPCPRGGALPGGRPATTSQFLSQAMTSKEQM